jgi:hypothetical protein
MILLISASWVARTISLSHWHRLKPILLTKKKTHIFVTHTSVRDVYNVYYFCLLHILIYDLHIFKNIYIFWTTVLSHLF